LSYKKRIYRAAVSQRLRNTGIFECERTHPYRKEEKIEARHR